MSQGDEEREPTLAAAESFGRYRILRKIGSGGMGEVFLARDELLRRNVALKVLLPEVSADADRIERFQREARAIAALNHPNIVTIYDYGVDHGRHYFVTEYVAGTTLREWMGGRCDVAEAIRIAKAIARALGAAHAQLIVHRDIKPENVLMATTAEVKVVDFGIAKLAPFTAPAGGGTRAGMIVGTASYMAPEQIRGEPLDGRADVFSLGVVMYEMLAARRPFSGGTMQDTMAAILTSAPQPLASSEIDMRLAALVMSMLAKNREVRPTAEEVLRELETMGQPPPHAPQPPTVAAETNLPSEPSPIAGRDREIGDVVRLLQRDDLRLVTITGAAGTGKTRLATRAAREMLSAFSDGVWFIPLDAIHDPALVSAAIAEVLHASDASAAALSQRLRHARALLVLDNFEQVIDAASFVAALLRSTDALKILVTSQAPLHIRAEHEYALDPLPVPAENSSFETIRSNAAVAMFVDRARSVRPDFALTNANAADIARICRILGGVPLAIELAAVRVKMLDPAAIVARLADPLAFLVTGPRDLPDRQRTLRSAIEWSYGLLTEDERAMFAALSIFDGGWPAEAALHVCGEAAEELLAGLVDKNLVRQTPTVAEQRFTMLDAIRHVATSKLGDDERRALADRHLEYFAAFAESAESHLVGAEQPLWLGRLSADQANLRGALAHASRTHQTESGLRLACGAWRFWHARGLYAEGRRWLAHLRGGGSGIDRALLWKSWYAEGVLADAEGDYAAAYDAFANQVAMAELLDDRWAVVSATNNLAIAAFRLGRFDEAVDRHRALAARWREEGNLGAAALSLQNAGAVERARGNRTAARAFYTESIATFRQIGDQRGIAIALTCIADIDCDEGHVEDATARYQTALDTFMRLNDHWQVAKCMADYGLARRMAGDRAKSLELLAESALIFRQSGDLRSTAQTLDNIVVVLVEEQRPLDALRVAGAATAFRRAAAIGDAGAAAEDAVATAHAMAGAEGHDAWTSGLTLSVDQAIESVQPL